jgi:hypothetical protein
MPASGSPSCWRPAVSIAPRSDQGGGGAPQIFEVNDGTFLPSFENEPSNEAGARHLPALANGLPIQALAALGTLASAGA